MRLGSGPGKLEGCHLEEGRERFMSTGLYRTYNNATCKMVLDRYEGKKVVQQWNRLPKEMVSSPSLAVFKQQLDKRLAGIL